MTADNKLKTATGLSTLWDGKGSVRSRAGEGVVSYEGKRLSMHLMMQGVLADGLLSDDVAVGQGLLARCLVAWPESLAGERFYHRRNAKSDQRVLEFANRVAALLAKPLPMTLVGASCELEPPSMTLSADAFDVYRDLYNGIEAEQAADGRWSTMRAFASKAAEHALRVAAVIAKFHEPDGLLVPRWAMESAARMIMWYLDEWMRLAGTAAIPAAIKRAEKLLEWLHAREMTEVYPGQIVRLGPSAMRTTATVVEALELLERHGYVRNLTSEAKKRHFVDGKMRARVWEVLPLALT